MSQVAHSDAAHGGSHNSQHGGYDILNDDAASVEEEAGLDHRGVPDSTLHAGTEQHEMAPLTPHGIGKRTGLVWRVKEELQGRGEYTHHVYRQRQVACDTSRSKTMTDTYARIFIGLTAMAATLVAINIAQAFLIDRLHETLWIVGFPLVVIGVLFLTVIAYALWVRSELVAEWTEAKVAERLAWIGVILSILIPLIVCQFVYMPMVAVPKWHRVDWTAGLEIYDQMLYPAVVIASLNPEALNIVAIDCTPGPTNDAASCNTSSIAFESSDDLMGKPQYVTSDPKTKVDTGSTSPDYNAVAMMISFNYSSVAVAKSGNTDSGFKIGLYDPSLPFNFLDFWWDCGTSPLYSTFATSPNTGTYITARLEASLLSDPIGALQGKSSDFTGCSGANVSDFTYYTASVTQDSRGRPLLGSWCDVDNSTSYEEPCEMNLKIHLDSALRSTRNSSHGIDTLEILTDEGSIIGGILFLTWFLGIFIL